MKCAEYPKEGLLFFLLNIAWMVILFGLFLLFLWIDPIVPIIGKIVMTIAIVLVGGGLIVGKWYNISYKMFIKSGKK